MIPFTEINLKLVVYYVDLKSILVMHYGILLHMCITRTPPINYLKPALLSNQ